MLKLLLIALFFSVSYVVFLNFGNTAVTWPASDNLPGVCRLLQSSCLEVDFFATASSGITPRLPYIYILSELTRYSGNGLGGGVAIVKALILLCLPIITTLLFIFSVKTQVDTKEKSLWTLSPLNVTIVASAPIFVYILESRISSIVNVAFWQQINFEPTPHNVALLLTLLGFILSWSGRKLSSAFFIAVGVVVHPAVGIFTAIFSLIVLCKFDSIKYIFNVFGLGLGVTIFSAAFVKYIFISDISISSEDFVRIYAREAHPFHYIPSQFERFGRMPWGGSFLIVTLGLLVATIALWKLKSTAWRNSFLAFIVYFLSVLVQYLFVEILPIKSIAILGPSRFTMFGLWLLCIFYFVAVLEFIRNKLFLRNTVTIILAILDYIRSFYIIIFSLILGWAIVVYARNASDIALPDDARDLTNFAKMKTNKNDIFVLPFFAPRVEFTLLTNRAIFSGNGFPFSEKYFLEWEERHILVHGSNSEVLALPGKWIGDRYANHYRNLLPKDFIAASQKYKLDYVVIETSYSVNFSDCRADFTSIKYKVYSISNLLHC